MNTAAWPTLIARCSASVRLPTIVPVSPACSGLNPLKSTSNVRTDASRRNCSAPRNDSAASSIRLPLPVWNAFGRFGQPAPAIVTTPAPNFDSAPVPFFWGRVRLGQRLNRRPRNHNQTAGRADVEPLRGGRVFQRAAVLGGIRAQSFELFGRFGLGAGFGPGGRPQSTRVRSRYTARRCPIPRHWRRLDARPTRPCRASTSPNRRPVRRQFEPRR